MASAAVASRVVDTNVPPHQQQQVQQQQQEQQSILPTSDEMLIWGLDPLLCAGGLFGTDVGELDPLEEILKDQDIQLDFEVRSMPVNDIAVCDGDVAGTGTEPVVGTEDEFEAMLSSWKPAAPATPATSRHVSVSLGSRNRSDPYPARDREASSRTTAPVSVPSRAMASTSISSSPSSSVSAGVRSHITKRTMSLATPSLTGRSSVNSTTASLSSDSVPPASSYAASDTSSSTAARIDREPKTTQTEISYITDEAGNILSLQEHEWNDWLKGKMSDAELKRMMSPNVIGRNLFEFIDDAKVETFNRHLIYMIYSGQQSSFQYFWFCDSADIERKLLMTVTGLDGLGTRLILWTSKVISEKVLKEPMSYLNATSIRFENAQLCGPVNVVCSYCKRIMVLCEDMPSAAVDAIMATRVPDLAGLSSPNIPVLGLRGKLGTQVNVLSSPTLSATVGSSSSKSASSCSASLANVSMQSESMMDLDEFSGLTGVSSSLDAPQPATTHLWLSPHQYYVIAGLRDPERIRHGVCEVCYQEIGNVFFPAGSFKDGVRVSGPGTMMSSRT